MRKLLLAGLLGAIVGGGIAYAAGRYAQAKPAETAAEATGDPSPRSIAEGLLEKLKDGKTEEFADLTKASTHLISEIDFLTFKKKLLDARGTFMKAYGSSLGEFELIREQVAGPSVVRLIYVERFEKNGMTWVFVMYRGKEGWKVASVNWIPDPAAALPGAV